MKTQKQLDDYCSDEDIFLSPAKRNKKPIKCIKELSVPIQGVYEDRIRRLKSCLIGIPRPPIESVSVNFNMEDVYLFLGTSRDRESDCSNKPPNNILEGRKFGIYLNVDHSCEELERLVSLYIEKYLPCETLSTMSAHSSNKPLTASAKKRRRCNGWASSPGSRLSYLARRKSTFSVDQVAKMGQPATSKQFLLQRDQTIKGIKSVPLKPKRALFQSPDEDKKHNPFRTPDVDERKKRIRRLSMPNPHSARVPQQNSPRENRKQRNCRKSLEFSGSLEKNDNCRSIEPSDKHVRRKLLWAVSTALKGVSVTSSHSKFKICMNKLFKASLSIWTAKHQDKKSFQENAFSTSEAMLILAKSLLEDVVFPELNLTGKRDVVPFFDVESDNSFPSQQLRKSQDGSNDDQRNTTPLPKVCSEEGSMPLRTLSELTNSPKSSFTPDKNDQVTGRSDMKSSLPSPESTLMNQCFSEPDRQQLYQHSNLEEEFRYSNHKRKLEELDEEEFMQGFSSLDYQLSISAKKVCRYRTRSNKLSSSCA